MSNDRNTEIMESLAEKHAETCQCQCCENQNPMCGDCRKEVQDKWEALGEV